MAYIGRDIRTGAFRQLDDISSGFDGSDTTHTMQVNSTNVSVGDVNQILLSLGGVIQKPGTDFTVSGSTLTFTTAPAANTSFFAILLGSDNGGTVTPTDSSVTDDKLADTISEINNTGGNLTVDVSGEINLDADDGKVRLKDGGTEVARFVLDNGSGDLEIVSSISDKDIKLKGNDGGSNVTAMTIDMSEGGLVRIGGTSHTNSLILNNHELVVGNESSGASGIAIVAPNNENSYVSFFDPDNSGSFRGSINYNHSSDFLRIYVAGSERFRIDSAGDVFIGKTTDDGDTVGHFIDAAGAVNHVRDNANVLALARNTSDGAIVAFRQGGSQEGTISVSGSTIAYNAFTGSHLSRLADNSKPTILRGTIMDSIDEMCEWYQAVADIAESKDEEGNVIPAHKKRESIALPEGKSVGDAVTFTSSGVEYTGVYEKEIDVKHTKSKVSDLAESKKVYGVFHRWDDADDGLDGDVNDMEIAQVGTYIIRVNKDVTVEAGDLLVSNGDGTAKKQDDDIIRSKTVAKVNSNIKVETYSDGSYTVPCTLHC